MNCTSNSILPAVPTLHRLQLLTEWSGRSPLQVGGDTQQPGGAQFQCRQGSMFAVQSVPVLFPGLQQVLELLSGGLRPGAIRKLSLHLIQDSRRLLHLRGGPMHSTVLIILHSNSNRRQLYCSFIYTVGDFAPFCYPVFAASCQLLCPVT